MGFDLERGDGKAELHTTAQAGGAHEHSPLVELFGQALTRHLLTHQHALERYRSLAKRCDAEPSLRQLVNLTITIEEQHGRLLDAMLRRLRGARIDVPTTGGTP